ncbi:guanylate-binding protein [Tieghemostelium lacteum]|uniref:Guanylate-binding protein n=1 Tax=Tieghemostelium lacteum TaxID=361077 RepID=A0A152A1H2_TIELA|nr:guanylate-binding protein [Tieghemostelium lacteum]|eukprot:KYQ99920.1 guanylate-binding protein [Tieghemostelium lacteum]
MNNLILIVTLVMLIGSTQCSIDKVSEIFKPTQLLYPDSNHQQILINQTSLGMLNSLIDSDLSILGVVGSFHSGKSFLLNQLMGTTDKFVVGPTVHPETKGIWIMASNIQYQGKEHTLLLLDTEGFYSSNVSETYDAKIFAITTLLSSHLLYNSVKIIDQSELEYLELLSRRTQLFALKSQIKSSRDNGIDLRDILNFPSLTWVVQDFFQDIEYATPNEWLHSLLSSRSRDSDSSLSIGEIFPSIDCHTLFIPSGDKKTLRHLDKSSISDLNPTYLRELYVLKDHIFNSLKPKMSGPSVSSLLKLLVDVANGNKFPSVPSIWSGFIREQQHSAHSDAVIGYRDKMDIFRITDPPMNDEQLNSLQKSAASYAGDLYKQLLFGLSEAYNPGLKALEDSISSLYDQFQKENQERIKGHCLKLYQNNFRQFQRAVTDISIPMDSKELTVLIDQLSSEAIGMYRQDAIIYEKTNHYTTLYSQLSNDLERVTAVRLLQNKNELESILTKTSILLKEMFKERFNHITLPIPKKELSKLYKEVKEELEDEFKKKTMVAKKESFYTQFLDSLEMDFIKLYNGYLDKNEEEIASKARLTADLYIHNFKKTFPTDLPIWDEEYLSSQLETNKKIYFEKFKSEFKDYAKSESYLAVEEYVFTLMNTLANQRILDNIQQAKIHVTDVLNRQKQSLIAKRKEYILLESYKSFIMKEVEMVLANKIESKKLRDKVINSFIENDLKHEIQHLWTISLWNTGCIATVVSVILFFILKATNRKSTSTSLSHYKSY